MAARVLEVKLTGDSVLLERAFANAERSATKAATGMEAAGARMSAAGAKMQRTGRSLTHGLTLPIIGLGFAAAKMSLDFNRSMSLISTQAGGTAKEVKHLSKEVLALAENTKFSPNDLAQGLFHIESAGYRGAKAMNVLNEAQKLATVGNSDLESTTYAFVSAAKALGTEGPKQLKKLAAEMNAAVGSGDMRLEELTEALSSGILPAAISAGLGFRDVASALDVMTARGEPAQVAATRLRMGISLLSAPTKKAVEALKEIGLGSMDLAETMRRQGLGAAIKELADHLSEVSATEANKILGEAFGGGKSSATIKSLVQNVGELPEKYEAIASGVKNYNRQVKEAKENDLVKLQTAWSSIQVSLVKIGDVLVPMLVPDFQRVAGFIGKIGDKFSKLPKGMQGTVVEVGLIAVALGPLLSITGKLLSGWGKLFTLVGKVGRALEILPVANAAGSGGGVVPVGTGAGAGRAATTTEQSVGAYGEKQALRDVGLIGGGTAAGSLKGKIADMGRSLGRTVLGVAGGYIVAEVGVHGLKALGVGDPTEGQGIAKSLTHGFNTDHVASTEKDALNQYRNQERAFESAMVAIQLHQLAGLGRIKTDLHQGLEALSGEWKTNKVAWRIQTDEAMQQTIASIKGGMRAGTIPVKQGKEEIERLLGEIKIVKGSDPLGLASTYSKEFKKAGGITQAGINDLIGDFKLMPKGAREAAQDSVLEQVNAWAKGHPKIEAQVDVFRKNLEHKFGRTNTRISHGVSGFIDTVGNLFASLAESVTGSINIMGVNVSGILKQLGITKAINFTVNVAKAGVNAVKGIAGMVSGRAQGGGVRVPGSGLRDTVPLAVNGAMAAVVAPGEDLVVLNRHQRPLIDRALANEYGVAGLPGFFSAFDRPHYMAKGGQLTHPEIAGGTAPMRHMGQAMIDRVYRAERAYIQAHRPRGGAPGGPSGTAIFDGKPVAKWIIPELAWARRHGWDGAVTSGWRDPNEVVHGVFATAPQGQSEHQYTRYPRGAVDLSDYEQFAQIISSYPGPRKLIQLGIDPLHFSGTGHARGGVLSFARGGIHGPPLFHGEGPQFYAAALKHNQPWATHQAPWNTRLSVSQEKSFRRWGRNIGGHDLRWWGFDADRPVNDYDMRGYWLHGGRSAARNGHFTDAWKTPYDTTFSNESRYAKKGTPFVWTPNYRWLYDRRTGREIISGRYSRGGTITGKVSTFGPPTEGAGTTASGASSGQPGIAIYDQSTLGDWFKVSIAGHTGLLRQTDIGPAPWTGRKIDVTGAGAEKLGISPGSFPTDSMGSAVDLGHSLDAAKKALGSTTGSSAGQKVTPHFGLQQARAASIPPLGPTPLLPSAKALPKSIKSLLRAPGLSYAGKVGIGEFALQQAEGTEEFQDDVAALHFQEELLERRERDLKHDLKKVRGDLKQPQSGKARAKSLARAHVLEEQLRETRGGIADVHTSLREAKPTERDRADLQLARAESTSGKQDDIEALKHLEDLAKRELERAEKSGDPREIAEATRELKSAADALREATPSEEDFANRDLALAELTESTEDDKAAMEHLLAIAEAELSNALNTPDPRDDIESAQKVKQIRDSLKAIEEATTGQLEQEVKALREEMEKNRHIAESELATSAAVARRALTDLIAGELGARTAHRSNTAGDGSIGTLGRM